MKMSADSSQTLENVDVTDLLFRSARTFYKWREIPVSEAQIRTLYELTRLAPTSGNCCPARFVFVWSPEGKELLKPALSRGNLDKTMSAPVTAIVAYDEKFYKELPILFPHGNAISWFTSSEELAHETAFRNGSMQGAYLIMAARSIGLDCGPMSGFKNELVDATFFAGTSIKSNFLINIGYGDSSGNYDRLPRLSFEAAAKFA